MSWWQGSGVTKRNSEEVQYQPLAIQDHHLHSDNDNQHETPTRIHADTKLRQQRNPNTYYNTIPNRRILQQQSTFPNNTKQWMAFIISRSATRVISSALLILILVISIYWSLYSHCSLFPSYFFFSSPTLSSGIGTTPWMDTREVNKILSYLDDDQHMLEYGSGASSFFFSQFVSSYTSIEHDIQYCLTQLIPRAEQLSAVKATKPQRIIITQVSIDDQHNTSTATILYDNQYTSPLHSLFIYCVSPPSSSSSLSAASSQPPSFFRWCYCCFYRCPSTLHDYNYYVNMSQWLQADNHYNNHPLSTAPRYTRVLIDGRARPQCAYYSIPYTEIRHVIYFVHDWNEREAYHIVLRWFNIIDDQYESEQPGGGGLVVLQVKVKNGIRGKGGIELTNMPSWWY